MIALNEAFNYELPRDKIALRPVRPYDRAKLLRVSKDGGQITEKTFLDLPALLGPDDVLVFNDTKVNKARLFGNIKNRQKKTEFLIIKKSPGDIYHCIARPIKNLKPGTIVNINDKLQAEICERISEQVISVKFQADGADINEILNQSAVMPIPPYIRNGQADSEDLADYQTVFAKNDGSIAAPTASLHFTAELISNIKKSGVAIEMLTLHLGMPSVRPLWDTEALSDNSIPELRQPGKEYFVFDPFLKNKISGLKKRGKRIIAVGTSVVRALEAMALLPENTPEGVLFTELFIRTGFEFMLTDAMITNFHFPASSHLLLVQAMLGKDVLAKAYDYALKHEFRFLSYGDGMLIE